MSDATVTEFHTTPDHLSDVDSPAPLAGVSAHDGQRMC